MFKTLVLFLSLAWSSHFAFATPDIESSDFYPTGKPGQSNFSSPQTSKTNNNNLAILGLDSGFNGATLFERTQYILKHLGIEETDYSRELVPYNHKQSVGGLKKLLKYFDPKNTFLRLATIDESDDPTLKFFQDIDSKKAKDFKVALIKGRAQPLEFKNFSPTAPKPLEGLRIALDPGHMGGDFWDEFTGKDIYEFPADLAKGKKKPYGRKLSEGVLNLQTTLLLKDSFEKLGAKVLVTHEALGPVTTVRWDTLKASDYAPGQILQSMLSAWFIDLAKSAPIGPQLDNNIDANPMILRAYGKSKSPKINEAVRSNDFILHADLDARIDLINNFKPDIVLIIHNDTAGDLGAVSPGHDYTKTYVAGGFAPTEFSGRKHHRDFAEHLLDPGSWVASVELSRKIVASMGKNLGLRPDRGLDGSAVEIEPGIQARNLNLTRELQGSALSYVECLYYDDPKEFFALLKPDHQMNIAGVVTYYSDRLVHVASAIEEAVLSFVSDQTFNSK